MVSYWLSSVVVQLLRLGSGVGQKIVMHLISLGDCINRFIAGVLYAGMMLTKDGPKTLEFNCRFGDPETQVILPLLRTDLYDVVEACRLRKLAQLEIQWEQNEKTVGVIMASKGYPETSTKGCVISGRSITPVSEGEQLLIPRLSLCF